MTELLVEVRDRDIVIRRPASGYSITYRRVVDAPMLEAVDLERDDPNREEAEFSRSSVESRFCQSKGTRVALMLKMAFQVVELTLDADQNVVDRRVIPYPYPTRKDAVDAIESLVTSFPQSGYQPDTDSWWVLARDGTRRISFAIETV